MDEESQELCTIITPFGKFKYKRLPMGASCSSDIAQEIMEKVLFGLEEVETFIDDIGIFSDNWESHLKSINVVLKKLEDAGFTVNPLKCEWAVQETDWLGYWLTPVGLISSSKKICSILAWDKPKTQKVVRSFIGAVNIYCNVWPHRSEILAPLTELTGNKPFILKKTNIKRPLIK